MFPATSFTSAVLCSVIADVIFRELAAMRYPLAISLLSRFETNTARCTIHSRDPSQSRR